MGASAWASLPLEVLDTSDFAETRLNRPGRYVVCFAAAWCPITRRFLPKFVAERARLPATLAIADITDTDSRLWDTFRIAITPSIVVFEHGEVVFRVNGRRFLGIGDAALRKLEKRLGPPLPS